MTAKLLFLDGDIKGDSFTLKPEGTSLGRETDNDIILQEGEISRHHARVLQKDGEWIFKDLGSSSGTTVNDLPVKEGEQVLNPGDIIIMGRHKFKFETGIGDVTMIGGLSAAKTETPKEETEASLEDVPEKAPEPVSEKLEEDGSEPAEKAESSAERTAPAKKQQPVPAKKEAPFKKESKPVSSQSAALPPKKNSGGKVLFGCGGCGCLLTLLLLPAGIFMMIMAGDSHLSELGPFGFILTPIGAFIGVISLVLLIIGMVKKKKS